MPAPSTHTSAAAQTPPPHTTFETLTARKTWFGDYDYGALCMPRLPCLSRPTLANSLFIGLHDTIPIIITLLMGLQHALAMAGGTIVVPRILAGPGLNHLNLDPDEQAYLITATLVVSGLTSIINTARIRLVHGYWLGTGLISMGGTAFAFVPVAEATFSALFEEGLCESGTRCPEAYGKWLGTMAIGSLAEIAVSFLPSSVLRALFPPIVTGSSLFLLGASLVSVGLRDWAGGSGPCLTASTVSRLAGDESVPESMRFFLDCPNVMGPGDRHYPWGAPEWIGLGFFVIAIIILIELFGSPFLRSLQIMIGLVSGIILSAALGYLNTEIIESAPIISFPLVRRFPLGVYVPALIPVMLTYVVVGVGMIGTTASVAHASRIPTEGADFETRVHGGLLADGVSSLLSALLTSSPTTTYSHNNAIVIITGTANTYAGIAGGVWLVLFGMAGKLGGVVGSAPDAVIGGMSTVLFASVAVAGLEILTQIEWTRRDRFILAVTLGIGLGVVTEPHAFATFIPRGGSAFTEALRQSVVIVMSTGFSIGAVISSFMNLILPMDSDDETALEKEQRCSGGDTTQTEDLTHVAIERRCSGDKDS